MSTGLEDLDDDDNMTPLVEADVRRLTGSRCWTCGSSLCAHAALLSVVLGFRDAGRCPPCFAGALQRPEPHLLSDALSHIRHRACFSRALRNADARGGCGPDSGCAFGGIRPPPPPPPPPPRPPTPRRPPQTPRPTQALPGTPAT